MNYMTSQKLFANYLATTKENAKFAIKKCQPFYLIKLFLAQ